MVGSINTGLSNSLMRLGYGPKIDTVNSAVYKFCEANNFRETSEHPCDVCRENFINIGRYCQGNDGKPEFPDSSKDDLDIPSVICELQSFQFLSNDGKKVTKPSNYKVFLSRTLMESGSELWEESVKAYFAHSPVNQKKLNSEYFNRVRKMMEHRLEDDDIFACIHAALRRKK